MVESLNLAITPNLALHQPCIDVLAPGQTDRLLDRLWHLEEMKDVGEIVRLTVI